MAIHVATVALMNVNATGVVILKESSAIQDYRTDIHPVVTRSATFTTEHRIITDAGIPNSAGNPTIQAYLTAEEAAGFLLQHMDQTFIITRMA